MPTTDEKTSTDPAPARGAWSKASATRDGSPPRHPQQNSIRASLHRFAVKTLRHMPRPLIRIAADQYIAGETREQALRVVDRLWSQQQVHSTCDVLGEDVSSDEDIQAYDDEFEQLIRAMKSRHEFANVSIKLSALGQEIDEEKCYRRARRLLGLARDCGTFMRLDMEDATTTDSSLRLYRRFRSEGLNNVGIVLQSRLFRTRQDIQDLVELRPNVRLCIGIYREPPEIALQNKDQMKHHMLELLEVLWRNDQHVGLATHEEWVIREALALARRLDKPLSEVEVQMLLGVPRRRLQKELVASGVRVRLYVPYGEQWHAYSMRRLENNPDMLSMVAWNVISRPFLRQ